MYLADVIAPGTAWPPTASDLQLILRNFFGGGPDGGYNASAANALASAVLAVYPPSSIALLNIGLVAQVRRGVAKRARGVCSAARWASRRASGRCALRL